MKKILFIFILTLLVYNNSFSQIKQRTVSTSVYTGIGYKFVFLTNQTARDIYPFFELSNGNFLKEIEGFLGITIDERYSVEFAPSYLFTNSYGNDGFYYVTNANRRFYVPTETRLFALPLNLKIKFFPFAKNYSSSFSKFYIGGGGGAMYIDEEIISNIYSDDTEFTYLGAVYAEDTFWTGNYEFNVGISGFSKIGYGFELSYRIVPLNESLQKPLVTSLATNLNSVNLSLKIIFNF